MSLGFIGRFFELGYDIKKIVELFYLDDGRTLQTINDDVGYVGLA